MHKALNNRIILGDDRPSLSSSTNALFSYTLPPARETHEIFPLARMPTSFLPPQVHTHTLIQGERFQIVRALWNRPLSAVCARAVCLRAIAGGDINPRSLPSIPMRCTIKPTDPDTMRQYTPYIDRAHASTLSVPISFHKHCTGWARLHNPSNAPPRTTCLAHLSDAWLVVMEQELDRTWVKHPRACNRSTFMML